MINDKRKEFGLLALLLLSALAGLTTATVISTIVQVIESSSQE